MQKSLVSLTDLLGHEVVIEPEWQLLVAELEAFYADDKGNLVTAVVGCIQAWAKSMAELLDDDAHYSWTETVLEKVPSRMRVFVEVASSDAASTAWSEQRGGFVVSLPKKKVFQPASLFPVFRGDLLSCFDEGKKKSRQPAEATGAGDDWVGMEVDAKSGNAEVVENPRSSQMPVRAKVEFLPTVASLPRPDQLFLQPPYHLSMSAGHQQIELQCSHSPSLQFLAEYLKRWCRVNHADTRNVSLCSLSEEISSLAQLLTFMIPAPRRRSNTSPVSLWTGRDV